MSRTVLIFVSTLALAAPAAAQTTPRPTPMPMSVPMPDDAHLRPSLQSLDAQYFIQIEDLRRKALAIRKRDGGVLSAADRAALQARLDRLNEYYLAARDGRDLSKVDGRR